MPRFFSKPAHSLLYVLHSACLCPAAFPCCMVYLIRHPKPRQAQSTASSLSPTCFALYQKLHGLIRHFLLSCRADILQGKQPEYFLYYNSSRIFSGFANAMRLLQYRLFGCTPLWMPVCSLKTSLRQALAFLTKVPLPFSCNW